jgi:hypothetical protein
VQLRDPLGSFLFKTDAQQVGEQVVVAPPAAHLVERDQEQVGPLDRLQHRLAVAATGDGVAQFPRQSIEHRRLQQEGPHLGRLTFQHLVGQVVQDVAVAPRERRHEALDVGPPSKRQRRELEPGRPPFGPFGERRHGGVGQGHVGTDRLAEQCGGLIEGEAQVVGAELGEPPSAPKPGHRQRRVGAAGENQMQLRRCVLEQDVSDACTGRESIRW